jgi:cytochrome c2
VKRFTARFLALALGVLAAFAAGDPEKGQELFKTCLGCHRIDSDQRKAAPSLRSLFGKVTLRNGKRVTEENVREIVLDGYNQMPPFRYNLTAAQADDLMAFLKTLKAKPLAGETANASAGFTSYCMSCHNPELHGERGPVLRGLFTRQKLANGDPADEKTVQALIDEGHAKAPAFKNWLDEAARRQIVDYLKTY